MVKSIIYGLIELFIVILFLSCSSTIRPDTVKSASKEMGFEIYTDRVAFISLGYSITYPTNPDYNFVKVHFTYSNLTDHNLDLNSRNIYLKSGDFIAKPYAVMSDSFNARYLDPDFNDIEPKTWDYFIIYYLFPKVLLPEELVLLQDWDLIIHITNYHSLSNK